MPLCSLMSSPETDYQAPLPTAVRWSHVVLSDRLQKGDIVVDATAGNGHDTLFLAQQVLPEGRVFVFDVQAAAIESTRKRLADSNYGEADGIILIQSSHEHLSSRLPLELRGHLRAIMFNLGFLPGGDKNLITQKEGTMSALAQALEWLAEGGLLSVVAYPGHEGGRDEADAIESWMASLPSDVFEAQKMGFINFRPTTPFCMVVRKRTAKPPSRS
jgi:hypothetical protein